MPISLGRAFTKNFLGNAPRWYKIAIVLFLLINPIIFYVDPFLAGWLLLTVAFPALAGGSAEAGAAGALPASMALATLSVRACGLLLVAFGPLLLYQTACLFGGVA